MPHDRRPDREQLSTPPSDSLPLNAPDPSFLNGNSKRRWKQRLRIGIRVGAGIALVTGIGLVTVGLGGRAYVQRTLLPQLETEIENALQRDITLGGVRFVWPWKVTLGTSEIEQLATVRSIDMRADVWTLLWRRQLAIALRLNQPDVTLEQAEDGNWGGLNLSLDAAGGGLPVSEITLEIANGQLELVPAEGGKAQLERWQGRVRVPLDRGEATWTTQARSDGGRIEVRGTASFPTDSQAIANTSESAGNGPPRIELDIQTDNLPATLLNLFPITSVFQARSGTVDVDLQGTWQANQPLDFEGEAIADEVSFTLATMPQPYDNFSGRIELIPGMATLSGIESHYGHVPLTANGTIEWDDPIFLQDWRAITQARLNLTSINSELTLTQLQDTFGLEFPVPVTGVLEGEATLTGIVTNPLLQGSFRQVAPASVSQLNIGTYSGNFALQGGQLNLTNLTGSLTNDGGRLTGSGRVNVTQSPVQADLQFAIDDADINGIVEAYQFDPLPQSLGAIDAQGQVAIANNRPIITADWQASGGNIGGNGRFDWRDDTATIPQSDLALGDSTAVFSAVLTPAAADGGRAFSARIIPQSVPLNLLVPDIAGLIDGDIQIDGTTRDLSLAGLEASGQVTLPDGIHRLPGPVTAQVAWDGKGLTITNGLVLNAVGVEGRIPFNIENQQVGSLALNLSARELPLESLQNLPVGFPVSGMVNLDGQLSGRPEALALTGQLGLVNLRAAGLDFAPLQGPLQWQPDSAGVEIDLVSTAEDRDDRLAISLNRDFAPQSFFLHQGETSATGQRQGDRFDIQLAQFPLALLNGIVPGVWNGTIDSELALNVADATIVGSATTYAPSWQGIQAERLQGSFAYGARQLSISKMELQLQDSLYRANGSVWLPTGPQRQIRAGRSQEVAGEPLRLDMRVSTEKGSLEGLLRAIRWQNWSDVTAGLPDTQLGPASELEVAAIDVLSHPLLERLEAYSAIVAQQAELLDRQVAPRIPALSNLTGEFSGDLQVAGPITTPTVSFDMTGRNWELAHPEDSAQSYALDRLASRGEYRENTLHLEILEAQSGDRKGSLSGTFGNDNQAGQLQLTRFPLRLVSDFFPDAPRSTGDLNATADISGTLQNPTASGQFDLEALAINGNQLDAAHGVFDYRQATLSLDGSLRSGSPNPVVVSGKLPLSLPFSTAIAPSNAIALELSARNEQLALLNLFTDAISWESGEGLLDITIGGTLENPTLDGGLTVSDGVVKLSTFPAPLHQLDASIDFDFNRINVQSLSGTFEEGTIEAAGLLAVNPEGRLQTDDSPLAVQLNDLQMDLPNLYRGTVDGDVRVGGTVLAPELGGGVRLTDGIISIPSAPDDSGSSSQWQPRFNQLELTLGDNVQVVRQPLFAFTTEGTLILDGTPSQLRPVGTVRIARGNINLGLANLRIDRGQDNTVVFDQQGGLDPLLDITAFTEVSEQFGSGVVTNETFSSSDSGEAIALSGQRTIQVIATMQGRGSDLTSGRETNSVELSSRPARSPEQILALLGGAALDGVGSGNLAGFALSTVLFGAQNALGNAIGLDELRVTPFAGESGNLEVGVEAAKELGGGVSVSVQQSLNEPSVNPRVNTRLRVSPNVLIRTGTDFQGDDRASFEFSTDF